MTSVFNYAYENFFLIFFVKLKAYVLGTHLNCLSLLAIQTRASRWQAIAYPVAAPSHISVHIKIPNAFLQSSSIRLSPVIVLRF